MNGPRPDMAEWFGGEYRDPYLAGAAVAFGIVGMASAIREQEDRKCFRCDGYSAHRDGCVMIRCGMAGCMAEKFGASAWCEKHERFWSSCKTPRVRWYR